MSRTKMSHGSWDVELLPGEIAEYKCHVRQQGGNRASIIVQVPKDVALALEINPGDVVEVAIRRVVKKS